MKLWCLLAFCLFCATAEDADVIVEREVAEGGIIPGLGQIMDEGSPGAMFPSQDSDEPAEKSSSSAWEGTRDIDPRWNQDFLQRREEEVARQKLQQLQAAIKIQKSAIEAHERAEFESKIQAQQMARLLGEVPVAEQAQEHDVNDGYVETGLDKTASADCTDDINPISPMTLPNMPPPPLLEKKYPQPEAATPTKEALRPLVEFTRDSQEADASIQVDDLIFQNLHRDISTEMPTNQYQSWGLESHDDTIAKKSAGETVTARSGVNTMVLAKAKKEAEKLLHQAFGSSEVENKEGGMDSNTAWGVMNANGAGDSNPAVAQEEQLVELSSSPLPLPSPSPSPLREINLENLDQGYLIETDDPAFNGESMLPTAIKMPENQSPEAIPEISFKQPPTSKQQEYISALPHPSSIDVSSLMPELSGMGNDLPERISDVRVH